MVEANTLTMGDTFQTLEDRRLYLICSESGDIEDGCSAINLATGRIEDPHDFEDKVLPINLVITEE